MNRNLIDLLACPLDGVYPLELRDLVAANGHVESGQLLCVDCGAAFQVASGIPRLLMLDDSEESETKREEIEARDIEWSASYDHLEAGRVPEVDAFRAAIGDCSNLRVLDAGCGHGVMTAVVSDAERVVGMDFSLQGLVNFRVPRSPNLDLLQADACQMPFRDGIFDLAISSQVLEHIPSLELRKKFIAELSRALRPGGRLVMSVYNWHENRPKEGMAKEGKHSSGIFYHCYSPAEFVDELSAHFVMDDLWAVQVVLPKTYRLVQALGKANRYWDRLWRKRKIALSHCHLLLATCRTAAGRRDEFGGS